MPASSKTFCCFCSGTGFHSPVTAYAFVLELPCTLEPREGRAHSKDWGARARLLLTEVKTRIEEGDSKGPTLTANPWQKQRRLAGSSRNQ